MALPDGFRLPGARDRLAVVGRTGSGKTHLSVWALSLANWPVRPWVIVDYKRDELIRDIPGLEPIELNARIPKHAGIYQIRPRPDQSDAVEDFLMRLWERGRTGLYVDEAHILPDRGGLQTVLTQGRSKSIPAVVVTQRPVLVSRFTFSEADYMSIFHLNDRRDRQTVGTFLPVDIERPLPERHSWYFDVAQNRAFRMLPVPDRDEVLDIFDRRMQRTRWRKL